MTIDLARAYARGDARRLGSQYRGRSFTHSRRRRSEADAVAALTDLRLRLRGDVVTLDGSDNASQWDDTSGNGHHATQATSGARPSMGTLGGQPALVFDGVDDVMEITHHVNLQADESMYWWIVVNVAASAGTNTQLFTKWGSQLEWIFPSRRGASPNQSGFILRNAANSANHIINGPVIHDGADKILRGRIDAAGTTMAFKVNDAAEDTLGSITFRQSTSSISIAAYPSGGGGHTPCTIAEIIMAVESDTDKVAAVDAYLSDRYGVAT